MKFDNIIMNPPYSGSLHLKVLDEAMKHCDNIVNLSPIRWLQDPIAEYKKNSDWKKFENIRNKIENIEIIPQKDANNFFGADFASDLGIYKISPQGGFSFDKNVLVKKLIKFVEKDNLSLHLKNLPSGNFLKFRYGISTAVHVGEHSKYFVVLPNFETSTTFTGKGHTLYLNNLSKKEQKNAHQIYCSDFMRWWNKAICSGATSYAFTPIFDFSHQWTDEDFYKYFGLNEDEIFSINNDCLMSKIKKENKFENVLNFCDKTFMDVSTEEGWKGEYSGIFGVINSHLGDMSRFVSDDYSLFCKARYTNTNKVLFFNSEEERKNCFNYLNSNFMKEYAQTIRTNQRIPWQFVPYLDFSQKWTDEKLYNYFLISTSTH